MSSNILLHFYRKILCVLTSSIHDLGNGKHMKNIAPTMM